MTLRMICQLNDNLKMERVRKNILVIEDHDSIRMLFQRYFSKSFEVTVKKDGFEGLAWLSLGNIPDLILLDMSMPRLNGIDFLNNIRNSGFFRDIPVIIVSGEEDTRIIDQCFQLGICDYVTKPFNLISLNDKINQVFAQTI